MKRYAALYRIRQPFLKRVSGPLLWVLILFYLGFHTVSGERGVFALLKETRHLETLTTELSAIKAQRQALDHKVKLLSSNSLDLDLLDEQARRVLGFSGTREVIVFTDGAGH
jgi:cell division protein FtsB